MLITLLPAVLVPGLFLYYLFIPEFSEMWGIAWLSDRDKYIFLFLLGVAVLFMFYVGLVLGKNIARFVGKIFPQRKYKTRVVIKDVTAATTKTASWIPITGDPRRLLGARREYPTATFVYCNGDKREATGKVGNVTVYKKDGEGDPYLVTTSWDFEWPAIRWIALTRSIKHDIYVPKGA